MTHLYDDRPDEGFLGGILRKIPGFAGYLEASRRREAEAQAREWIAGQLELGKKAIDTFARRLVDAGSLDSLPACDRLRGRLDTMIARLRGMPAGGGTFFSQSSLNEERLEDLYEYDLWMMDESEKVAKRMAELAQSSAAETLSQIESQVADVEQKWAQRQQLLITDSFY